MENVVVLENDKALRQRDISVTKQKQHLDYKGCFVVVVLFYIKGFGR